MEAIVAAGIGILVAAGVYLTVQPRTFDVVLGLSFISHAVNVFIFSMGRLREGAEPVIEADRVVYTDPLPQALVLTAIVIGFAMTAFVVVLALRTNIELGNDHVDGADGDEDAEPDLETYNPAAGGLVPVRIDGEGGEAR